MQDDFQTYQRIEDYLKNRLSEVDKNQFEADLVSNPNLASLFDLYQQADIATTLLQLQQLEVEVREWQPPHSSHLWKKFSRLMAVVLLSGLVSFFAFDLNNDNSSDLPSPKNNEPYPEIEPILKSSTPQPSDPKKLEIAPNINTVKKKPAESKALMTRDSVFEVIELEQPITKDTIFLDDSIKGLKQVPKTTSKIDCQNVRIAAQVDVLNTCEREATGEIVIRGIRGGQQPYAIILNDSLSSDNSNTPNIFSNLSAGEYLIKIIDRHECSTHLNNVTIEGLNCDTHIEEHAFAPSLGQAFEFPTALKAGLIQVFTSRGDIVHQTSFQSGEIRTWDGLDLNGQRLPVDAYFFLIKFEDGSQKSGYVTITN